MPDVHIDVSDDPDEEFVLGEIDCDQIRLSCPGVTIDCNWAQAQSLHAALDQMFGAAPEDE